VDNKYLVSAPPFKNCYFNFKLIEHEFGINRPPFAKLTKRAPRFPMIMIDLSLKQSGETLEELRRIIDES
jgi:hypothetical protein